MRAVIAHALIAWSLAAAGTFTKLALVSGGAICLVYIGCCAVMAVSALYVLARRTIKG